MKRNIFDKIVTIILLIICIALAFAIYSKLGKKNDNFKVLPKQDISNATNVNVREITYETFKKTVNVNGEISSLAKDVTVYPSIGGTLSSINVKRGDQVQQGDVLFSVDPSKPGMKYKQSEVTAPICGTIYEIKATIGDSVTENSQIIVIRGDRELKIDTSINEKNIGTLSLGEEAVITSVSYPDRYWDAEISYISDTLDTASRSLPIELSFTNGSDDLLEGMFVNANVCVLTLENVIVIPNECISSFAGEKIVYIAEDGRAKRVAITTGQSNGDQTVVLTGLKEGDKLIIAGKVSDGTAITIV